MPKETITHPEISREKPVSTGVSVSWGKDQPGVQVSLYPRQGSYLANGELYTDTRKLPLNSDKLTRSQINDLIRVLRKARDQAFGRDE